MSGGSEERESPHDRECPHCGLYYQDKGPSFDLHKGACDGASDSGASEEPDESTTERGASGPASRSSTSEGSGTESDVEFPDGPAADAQDTSEEEPECPDCGGNRWFDASQYTSGQYSHGCADCSNEEEWVVWNE